MTVASPFLLVVTVIGIFLVAMGEASSSYRNFSTVTGYFLQDDPATDPTTFDYVATGFGLINQSYDTDATLHSTPEATQGKTQWERFTHKVATLNRKSGPGTEYKLLFLGRHGEGYHNVAEAFYGTPAWDCYWSLQDGNGTTTWADAHLTPKGEGQARTAHGAWQTQIGRGIPLPQRYYTSPLHRCLETANITFAGLDLPRTQPFVPEVKELLRETIGLHTCDRRSTKTAIHDEFQSYTIERGFTEHDELWSAELRESNSARDARLLELLDDVFAHDRSTFISFTAHSGAITSILKVVGHRDFSLSTGGVIPVLVKAEREWGTPPTTSIEPPSTAPTCA